MKLSGWIYDVHVCPWIKVFDVDIKQNQRFSNIPYDKIVEEMIECDMCEIKKHAFHDSGVDIVFDNLFEIFGVNLKRSFNEIQYIKLDGKNAFKSCYGISTMNDAKAYECREIEEKTNYDEIPNDKIIVNDSSAMFTLINDKYMYFNMTSYGFWEPKYDFIAKKFNTANLGGCLIDITQHPEIYSLFPKEIF